MNKGIKYTFIAIQTPPVAFIFLGLFHIGSIISNTNRLSGLSILVIPLFIVTAEAVFLRKLFRIPTGSSKENTFTTTSIILFTLLNYAVSFVFASLGAFASIGYGIGQS